MLGLPEAKWEDTGKEQEQEASPHGDVDANPTTGQSNYSGDVTYNLGAMN